MSESSNHVKRPDVNTYSGTYSEQNRGHHTHKSNRQLMASSTSIHGIEEPRQRHVNPTQKTNRILIDATRDFGKQTRPSVEQIKQYKELFYQLIDRLDIADRRMISAMLARLTFTPRPVALYFAQDEVEIAAPFLLFSNVLGDLDLRAIAKKKGSAYAEIISKRQLPMDDDTKSFIDNISSQKTKEAPPPAQEEQITPTTESSKWLGGDEILALASSGGKLGKKSSNFDKPNPVSNLRKDARKISRMGKHETRELLSLARKQDNKAVASYVEQLCGLEADATLRLINAEAGDELVYLIKALAIDSPHNIQLLLMLTPKIGRDVAHYREARKLLSELDTGICQMIFNEIGAHFELTRNGVAVPTQSKLNPTDGYQDAARRRRGEFEHTPSQNSATGNNRYNFEQSFSATG